MAQRKPPARKPSGKTENREESVVLATINSPYNTLIPMLDAQYVRLRHPISRKSLHLATGSEEFLATMKELFDMGIGSRIVRELSEFAERYDAAWGDVLANVKTHVNWVEPVQDA